MTTSLDLSLTSPDILQGRDLFLARMVWVTVAVVMLGFVLASLPPYVRLQQSVCETCSITPAFAARLQDYRISPSVWLVISLLNDAMVFIAWIGMGTLVFLLKSSDRRALLLSGMLVVCGASFGGTIGYLYAYLPEWVWVHNFVNSISFITFLGLLILFPNGKFQPRWLAWLIVVETILFLPVTLSFLDPPAIYNVLISACLILTGIGVPIYRYKRVLTSSERQQARWVIFGFALAMLGIATTQVLFVTRPVSLGDAELYTKLVQKIGYSFSPLLVPVSIGIAVLRSRLWDIDVIIRKTLVYALLSGLLGLVYFGGVVVLQGLLPVENGQLSPIVVVVTTLVLAALFNPLHKRVQDFIDRRFYRRKYDGEKALADFASTARSEANLEALTAKLIDLVDETLQPTSRGLWLKLPHDQGNKLDVIQTQQGNL